MMLAINFDFNDRARSSSQQRGISERISGAAQSRFMENRKIACAPLGLR
jgi:hypothetical protein